MHICTPYPGVQCSVPASPLSVASTLRFAWDCRARSLAFLSKLSFNCPSLRRRRRLERGASARLQKRESDYCERSRQGARRASLHLVPHLPSSVNERLSGKNVYRVFRFENNWRQLFKTMVTHMSMGRSVGRRSCVARLGSLGACWQAAAGGRARRNERERGGAAASGRG